MRDLAATQNDAMINTVLGFIYAMNEEEHSTFCGNLVAIDKPSWKPIFAFVVKNNLRKLRTEIWSDDPTYIDMPDAKAALSEVFEDDFARGVTKV